MSIDQSSHQWRLFIDSSKLNLKAVLPQNGNDLPSVPLAYSIHIKETYINMKIFSGTFIHSWKTCADLKVVGILLRLEGGYKKYCCFLCEWDSRARSQHYIKRDWRMRINFIAEQKRILPQAAQQTLIYYFTVFSYQIYFSQLTCLKVLKFYRLI